MSTSYVLIVFAVVIALMIILISKCKVNAAMGILVSALILSVALKTPWEKIEARLLAAAQADFVVCLYNPSSRKRKDYLQKACDLMMKYKSPDTVCGTVAQIARDGETAQVMTLKELRDTEVDMFTTVFVGNSQTKNVNGKMVTPRGYKNV